MATTLLTESHYPDFFKPGSELDSFAETFPADLDPDVCPIWIDYDRTDIAPETYFTVGIRGFASSQISPVLTKRIPKWRQYSIDPATGILAYAQGKNKPVGQLSQAEVNTFVDSSVDLEIGLHLDQFSESGLDENSAQYAWYYERLRLNIDAAFAGGIITRKPFIGGGYAGPTSFSAQTSRFTPPDSHVRNPLGKRFNEANDLTLPQYHQGNNALQFTQYVRAGRQNYMGTNASTYMPSPGWVDDFYEWLNGLMMSLLARDKYDDRQKSIATIGGFLWDLCADFRDSFSTIWQTETTNPAGRLLTAQRTPIPPATIEAIGFFMAFFLDWVVVWGEGVKRISDPNALDSYRFDDWGQKALFFTPGTTNPVGGGVAAFPFVNSAFRYTRPKGPKNGRDFFYLGYRKGKAMRRMYTRAQFSFVDYSLDGAAYVTAQTNSSEVLYAASGFRRIVMRFDDGTNFRFVDFNPYGDSLPHTITAKRANGQEYTFSGIDGLLNISAPLGTDTTPAPVTFSILGSYNRDTKKLTMSGQNASGSITYQIPNTTDGFEAQPSGGFLIPVLLRGSTISIQAKTSAGQTAQTQISIPADSAAPVAVNTSELPEMMIGLYSNSTVSEFYDASPNINQFTSPIKNNDGIYIAGVSANEQDFRTPAYLVEFAQLAKSLNVPEKLGFYVVVNWDHVNALIGKNSWQPGLEASWKQYIDLIFNYAHEQGMRGGVAIWGGRSDGTFVDSAQDGNRLYKFLPRDQCSWDHDERVSNAGTRVPALRLFADLVGTDLNAIPTTNAGGQWLVDKKGTLRYLRPRQLEKSLTFVMIGTHTNGELGHDTRQDDPAGSWGDFHPSELAKFRAWLLSRFGSLAAVNARWGTNFASITDIRWPYSGNFADFNGPRGLDSLMFRHQRLGDAIEVLCRVTWSELPGVVIFIQFGQPHGGQGEILATMDIPYLIGRAQAVATELGYTHKCVGAKYNPGDDEDAQVFGSYMKYMCDDATGSALMMSENSYEGASKLVDAVHVSEKIADNFAYGRTGRAGDNVTCTAVLFSAKKWGGLQPDGKTGKDKDGLSEDRNNSVKAMLTRLFAQDRRRVPATSFGTTDENRKITITIPQMLIEQPPNDAPWFAKARTRWLGMDGIHQDVRWHIQGLGLPLNTIPADNTCVPVSGGSLGSDVILDKNSEYVFAINNLSGSTGDMRFVWVATNGAVLLEGGGANDFGAKYRFPNSGESVISCQVTNCGGSITRSVKATVPVTTTPATGQPYFEVQVSQPVYNAGNNTYSSALVKLINLKNATNYSVFLGEVTDNNVSASNVIPAGGFSLQAPPAGVSRNYTVRVWPGATDNTKWADRSFTVTSPASLATVVTQIDAERVQSAQYKISYVYAKLSRPNETAQIRVNFSGPNSPNQTYEGYTAWSTLNTVEVDGFFKQSLLEGAGDNLTNNARLMIQIRPTSNPTEDATVTVLIQTGTTAQNRTKIYPA